MAHILKSWQIISPWNGYNPLGNLKGVMLAGPSNSKLITLRLFIAQALHIKMQIVSCLPIICTVVLESERLYNLLLKNNFEDEPLSIQKTLKSIQKHLKTKDNKLFKQEKDQLLYYPRPSEQSSIIMAAHKVNGLGGIHKHLVKSSLVTIGNLFLLM